MIYKNKGPPKRPLLCDKLEFIYQVIPFGQYR